MNEPRFEPMNGEQEQRYAPVVPPQIPEEAPVSGWQDPYIPKPKREKKSRKKRTGLKLVALALCCSLLGGLFGAGGLLLWQEITAEEPVEAPEDETAEAPAAELPAAKENTTAILQSIRETAAIEVVQVSSGEVMTPAEVYAANVRSTVGITTAITTNYWGYETTSAAAGSGFILTADGYIITNYHVVENSSSITVSTYDGETYEAELIGYYESLDTAVLKVDAENLPPVILGNSDGMNVGDGVVAIGNPLGELTFSLTTGSISAKDREITLSGTGTMDLMQTDCAINSGNSGGALFNLYGEVIGITNAKYSSNGSSEASIDNIGFAIPINNVLPIVESIIEKGYISKPYLGVSVSDVSAEAQAYGIPQGAAIQSVVADGPAAKAGLQTGDVVTEANGTAITGSSDLVDVVGAAQPGEEMVLQVYRQGQMQEITVTIEENIQAALPEEEEEAPQQQQQQQQGGMIPWMPGFG